MDKYEVDRFNRMFFKQEGSNVLGCNSGLIYVAEYKSSTKSFTDIISQFVEG